MKHKVDPSGCIKFCESMGWPVIEGSQKIAGWNSPAGFNLLSPKGYKVRAFFFDSPRDSDKNDWLMKAVANHCLHDRWERAVLFYNDSISVSTENGKSATYVGVLHITKSGAWIPMFVSRSMASIDAVFEINDKYLSEPNNGFPPDDNKFAASLFNQHVTQDISV